MLKAMMTSSSGFACPECGIIGKSGKSSCCGRGGSWSGHCGSASSAKLRHTWYEGIQACETWSQLKAAQGRHSNAAQQPNSSSNGVDIVKANTVTITVKTPSSLSADTSETATAGSTGAIASANALTSTSTTTTSAEERGTVTANYKEISTSANNAATRTFTVVTTKPSPSMLMSASVHASTVAMNSTDTGSEQTIAKDLISDGVLHARDVYF